MRNAKASAVLVLSLVASPAHARIPSVKIVEVTVSPRPLGERTSAFHPYGGWVKLYVRSPAPVLSDPVPFTVDCGRPEPGR